MHIAVTGGLGRHGRYVVRELAQHMVRVIDQGSPSDCYPADLRDLDALREGLCDIEVVVHLGGIDRSVATDDASTMQANAMGTWNLFDASLQAGVRRVIYRFSSAVLGLDHSNPHMPPCYLPIDEQHPLRASDPYGLSKSCGEQIAQTFLRRGLEVIIIRPCFIVFPDMADFMAGKAGPVGRADLWPYLRAYLGPDDWARGFAAAAATDYVDCETFFLGAADTFASEPTVTRPETLYRGQLRLNDVALSQRSPRASPIAHAAAHQWFGWTHHELDRERARGRPVSVRRGNAG